MRTDRNEKRKGRAIKTVCAPILQYCGEGRARIDPSCVPDFACWILAIRARYCRTSHLTMSGLSGRARKIRQGQIEFARVMEDACDVLLGALTETVAAEEIVRARSAIASALCAEEREGA